MSTRTNTFVFIDVETTGLPADEYNRTKIIKLALVACTAENMAAANNNLIARRSPSAVPSKLPHVLHKLTLCLNPRRMIHPEATAITGLDNFQLEHEQPFSANTGALLAHFMEQLPQPVCLVAHNGDRFDFPLLRKELDRVGVKLPVTLRCVDSLRIFRQIDTLEMAQQRPYFERSSSAFDCTQMIMHDFERIIYKECLSDGGKSNGTHSPHPIVDGVQPQKRFRLQDVHQRLFDCVPIELHCAEADTLTLLRCVRAVQAVFLPLVDRESKLFADVQPLGR